MRKVLIEWREIRVHSYPAMLYLGLVCGVIGGSYAAALDGISLARFYPALLVLVLIALVGARLLFVAQNWETYRVAPGRILRRSEGGAILYGGLALAFPLSVPLLRGLGIPVGMFWDAATLTILIGMVITRFGCLLNGCCAGRPSEGPLSLSLPNAQGVWCRRLPTQLLEAGLAAMLLVGSVWAWQWFPFAGALFLSNVAAYGAGRWWLESMREGADRPGAMRVSRAFSLGLMAFSGAESDVSALYVALTGGRSSTWQTSPSPWGL